MSQYPIITVDKDEWYKKVNACLMYTIPSEEQALPILTQFQQILQRLHENQLQQTISIQHVPYFFLQVFPVVCQKIIKSRYFKSTTVLRKSNHIIQLTICLLPRYIDWLDKIPSFIDVIQSVFPDQFYFKTNNQLDHKDYLYEYFPSVNNEFQKTLTKGTKVDVLKFTHKSQKFYWSHGEVIDLDENYIYITYDLDYQFTSKRIQHFSSIIAPYQSKCTTWQWRKAMKIGDFIDVMDSFGGWYNATITNVIQQQDGRKKIDVTLKVYHQNGNKSDQNGKFFGFNDYTQTYDAFSPEVQPYCSVAKQFCYQSSKSQFDLINDQNDMQFTQWDNKTIYALPRKKNLSETIFKGLNHFGQLGGFEKPLQKIIQKGDISMLSSYLKGLGGVASYLHKKIVLTQITKIKQMLSQNLLSENSAYTKQKSQMLFTGLRLLLKRVYTTQVAYDYENNLKIQLVQQNFKHDSLKKKLQGLNELKEIIKSLTYGSSRNKKIIEWINQHKIFQKIYLVNSHVQLITKSENFFRYIINENILEVQDLQKLFKMAQKGDYQTRISLYSLFKEVSHIFKKHHVNFLIDKILQSQPNLILNEDIDLLHELSRFSNYFPTQKVMEFFEKLTLGEEIPKQINSYAIKKYSDMVAKNYQMKPYRKQVLKDLFLKLKTHDVVKVSKILKHIFQGIGVGQWGKKDLSDILQQQNFDQTILQCISQVNDDKNRQTYIKEFMDLLLGIYKLCSSFKIQITSIKNIYDKVSFDESLLSNFFKWCNQAFKCQQGVQVQKLQQLQILFYDLFKKDKVEANLIQTNTSLYLEQLQLLKSIFIEVNKRKKYITVSNIIKDKEIQKQYIRKVSMKQLTFYQTLIQFIYDNQSQIVSEKSIEFLKALYCSGQNSQDQIEKFLIENINFIKDNVADQIDEKTQKKLSTTLKIIQFVIDDSEKDCSTKVESLISKKKNQQIKLNLINSVNYVSDIVKKMEVTIPLNFTLYDLRGHLAKQLDIPWKSVKIQGKKQIPYELNCRTIKQLGLTGQQTLTVTKKPIYSEPQSDIIVHGEINPKAIRAFQIIFNLYSTQGKMNKTQCHDFTVKCLGSSSSPKYYEEKINSLFRDYDSNKDDLLSFQDFLKFYKTSAILKPSIVWSNLKSFGVQGNFKLIDQPSQQIDFQRLPRNIMSRMPQVYELLFRLLKQKQLASAAFNLLERLPVSKRMQQIILSVQQSEFNFQSMLDTSDLYVFFYKLNIIEYLVFSNQLKSDQQRDWVFRFVANKGFNQIINKLFQFINQWKSQMENNNKKIKLEILGMLIDLSSQFLMKCYANKQILECQRLLELDVQLNEKVQFLVTGAFPKKQTKLKQIQFQPNQQYQNDKFTKQQILQKILNLLEYIWTCPIQSNSSQGSNIEYLELFILRKLMLLIPILQINENFTNLINKMSAFINSSKNQKLLKKFYELILCVAFYSSENKTQKQIINEMFKHLTMKNIISEHFSILAVLVAKYGVQTVNEDQIIGALIENIFNSSNQLTIEGCSKLMLNFDLKNFNQNDFDRIWQNCLFGKEKRAKKNPTRQALYELILKSTNKNTSITNYVIQKVQNKISQCVEHMRITSCNQDNQRSITGYAGLKNLANICYINSMMQQLYMNKKFRYLVLRIKDDQPENLAEYKQKMYDDNILHQIQRIFAYLDLSTRADFVPAGFCLAYKPFGQSVNVMIQQDVQEFVSMFFDQLQNKIKPTPFKSVIDTFYGGKTTNLFNCHDCNKTKKVEQNFYSITLQVKNSKTLNDSFNRYISGELISDFRCDFCNKKVDVSKKTRISKPPKTLLIHLQRIVFNLDTFINEKISTRHQFPMNLNLYEYSLAQYQRSKQATQQQTKRQKQSMQYHLTGIICHIGNAESGHYISYIKIDENKWVEFNDSIVMSFSQGSIESECFGGASSNFLDDYEWDKASESSKSAYILLYQRKGQTKIQMLVKSLQQKELLLREYSLQQVINKVSANSPQKNQDDHNKKQQRNQQSQSDADEQRKQQDQMLKIQQEEIIRKKSRDIDLDREEMQQLQKEMQLKQQKQLTVHIDENIVPFIPENLVRQIENDNQIHFFERNLASPAFIKFFAHLLKQDHQYYDQIIKILKNLTFGFWMKSQHFKDLLKTCTYFIQKNIKYADELIFSNPQIVTLLIQNSDNQIRTSISNFLSNSLSLIIENQKLTLTGDSQFDIKITKFLNQLFSLLPTTVSKAWTKFAQYFQFWYEFAMKGSVQLDYMIRKQVLKHFLDYYLDKKSPLKIYENKATIGSKYANPNFSMLLKTVTYLIFSILNSDKYKLSKDDYTVLIHFDCLQKLISQNSQNLATNLVKQICKNNLYASEKVAIILLKGLHKSTYNNVQPYLDVVHSFILIDDPHQELRIKWVLGKPTLNLSCISKQITALNSYSFQQRLYSYCSTISLQQASSLLDPIYQLNKRAENFSMMSLRQVLRLCFQSSFVFDYVWNLPPPNLIYANIFDFYIQFIDRFVEESKKSYSYSQAGFNKEELGVQCKQIYQKLITQINQKQKILLQNNKQQPSTGQVQNQNTNNTSPEEEVKDEEQGLSPKFNALKLVKDQIVPLKSTYFPVKFNFIQKQRQELCELQIIKHESQISYLLLSANGKTNDSFISGSIKKNIQRIKQKVWQTQKIIKVSGFYIHNNSKYLQRIQTDDGTYPIKSSDWIWIWANSIQKVWECEKTSQWPKWSLYSIGE